MCTAPDWHQPYMLPPEMVCDAPDVYLLHASDGGSASGIGASAGEAKLTVPACLLDRLRIGLWG